MTDNKIKVMLVAPEFLKTYHCQRQRTLVTLPLISIIRWEIWVNFLAPLSLSLQHIFSTYWTAYLDLRRINTTLKFLIVEILVRSLFDFIIALCLDKNPQNVPNLCNLGILRAPRTDPATHSLDFLHWPSVRKCSAWRFTIHVPVWSHSLALLLEACVRHRTNSHSMDWKVKLCKVTFSYLKS